MNGAGDFQWSKMCHWRAHDLLWCHSLENHIMLTSWNWVLGAELLKIVFTLGSKDA